MGIKKIVVAGATGCTGRMTCEKLLEISGPQSEVKIILGGRDRRELERFSIDLGKRFKQAPDVRVFDFADRASLRALCDGAALVVNCVAPYSVSGPPLLATSVNAGAHLIDPSNEIPYIEQCFQRSPAVKEAGVTVVNGLAVDGGVADLAVEVASRGWDPVVSINILYMHRDVDETAGSRASWMEIFNQPCRTYTDRQVVTLKLGSKKREFRWPGGTATGKLMPNTDILLLPRHISGVRNIDVYRVLEGKLKTITSWLGSPVAAIGRLQVQSWAKDGSRVQADNSQFAVVIEADGMKARRFVVAQGKGIYDTSAALLARAAYKMVTDGPRTTGVVSPAQALEAGWLLKAVGIDLQVVDGARV